jgi:hypothetical protein
MPRRAYYTRLSQAVPVAAVSSRLGHRCRCIRLSYGNSGTAPRSGTRSRPATWMSAARQRCGLSQAEIPAWLLAVPRPCPQCRPGSVDSDRFGGDRGVPHVVDDLCFTDLRDPAPVRYTVTNPSATIGAIACPLALAGRLDRFEGIEAASGGLSDVRTGRQPSASTLNLFRFTIRQARRALLTRALTRSREPSRGDRAWIAGAVPSLLKNPCGVSADHLKPYSLPCLQGQGFGPDAGDPEAPGNAHGERHMRACCPRGLRAIVLGPRTVSSNLPAAPQT